MNNKYKNRRNAVVNPPFEGVHRKTEAQMLRRHRFFSVIHNALSDETKKYFLAMYRMGQAKTPMDVKQEGNSAFGRMVQNAN